MDALAIPPPAAFAELDRLMARGAAFFGARYALLGGAMSWVSERNLVAVAAFLVALGLMALSLVCLIYEVWISGGALRILLNAVEGPTANPVGRK